MTPRKKAAKKVGRHKGDTDVVDDAVIEQCAFVLARGITRNWAVKDGVREFIRERHGRDVSLTTVEKVLKLARARNALRFGQGKDEMRHEGLERYTSIRDDPESSARDSIRAQERIDELIGLSAKYAGGGSASPEAVAARARAALAEEETLYDVVEDNPAASTKSAVRPGTSGVRRPRKRQHPAAKAGKTKKGSKK